MSLPLTKKQNRYDTFFFSTIVKRMEEREKNENNEHEYGKYTNSTVSLLNKR